MSEACPRCGCATASDAGVAGEPRPAGAPRTLDLEALALAADKERAYDESARVRATQDDIRKLLARRRRNA